MAGARCGIAVTGYFAVGTLVVFQAGASDVFATPHGVREKRQPSSKKTSRTKAKKPAAAKHASARPTPLVLDDPDYPLDEQGRLLARELGGLWTRDPGRLVSVLQSAVKERHPETHYGALMFPVAQVPVHPLHAGRG